ncbi:MAG: TSUP family transporter [Desulfobacterales bacterium]|nr:TSUP family transporter [Desulfobacterales bacterium]
MDLSSLTLFLLFLTGLTSGFVDSIAGGGGLISLPVLLSVGMPPQLALGTNKLQASFGTLSSTINFIRKGKASLRDNLNGVAFIFIGAVLGAWAVQQIEAGFIRHLIPFMLFVVFVYTLVAKDLGRVQGEAKMGRHAFFMVFGLLLGFYDGFFGPGTGAFWTGALLILMGMEMTSATGTTRIMNFVSNVVALAVFIIGGNVLWTAGLVMAGGQIIGARIGSGMAIKRGAPFIRPIFLTMVFLTIVRLIYVNYV